MKRETSWESSSEWYDKIVGEKGHYYHEHVILPKTVALLDKYAKANSPLLDLACGQGVLSRAISPKRGYVGVDASSSLIKSAQKGKISPTHEFKVHDLLLPLKLGKKFGCATCILAVQNISDPLPLFQSAFSLLEAGGMFLVVLNHPCFRIPRQSFWGVDEKKKWQYRRIDRYMSPLEIPIQTHPGMQGQGVTTVSFHRPLSYYLELAEKSGFSLIRCEEWCSDKKSTGKHASMENKSRQEFPLFLTLVLKKSSCNSEGAMVQPVSPSRGNLCNR